MGQDGGGSESSANAGAVHQPVSRNGETTAVDVDSTAAGEGSAAYASPVPSALPPLLGKVRSQTTSACLSDAGSARAHNVVQHALVICYFAPLPYCAGSHLVTQDRNGVG
jgi:hypothetical protein